MVSVLTSGFPEKPNIAPGEVKEFDRDDWLMFEALSTRLIEQSGRVPAFGDFAFEHPTFPKRIMAPPSAQLRYTTPSKYVISKGQNVKKAGYAEIFTVAQRLIETDGFMGSDFSSGDARIKMLADRDGNTGNASVWKRITFNHHLRLTDTQLCRLNGVPVAAPVKSESHVEQFDLL